MDKCLCMHDGEQALVSAFEESKIPQAVGESGECNFHSQMSIGRKKMHNNTQFGRPAARRYCRGPRLASCNQEYEDLLGAMVEEFRRSGDIVRAEHTAGYLAATDIPLCRQTAKFCGINNNPSEQTNQVFKSPGKKKLSMLQFVCLTLRINQQQSMRPKVEAVKLENLTRTIEGAQQDGSAALDQARY